MKKSFKQLLRFGRKDDGGALAELAILVPFLIIMLAAVCEVGRYFEQYDSLAKSTRAGARYLSNHTYDTATQDKAKNLVACGALTCGSARIVPGIEPSNVCINYVYPVGSAKPDTVTVSIPRDAAATCGSPVTFSPIFNLGALLHNTFTMALPIAPSTTMYYMVDN